MSAQSVRTRLDVQARLLALARDDGRQVVNAELLRELVVDAHLSVGRRVVDRQLDAAHLQRTLCPGVIPSSLPTHWAAAKEQPHGAVSLPASLCQDLLYEAYTVQPKDTHGMQLLSVWTLLLMLVGEKH